MDEKKRSILKGLDVIVADALYMNAPFINLVKEVGMYNVIRAKNMGLNIVQDSLGLFKKRHFDTVRCLSILTFFAFWHTKSVKAKFLF